MQVPAVKRARDVVCSLSVLSLRLYDRAGVEVPSDLCSSPSATLPRSIVMSQLVDDLLMEGVAWWRVVDAGWYGYPTSVARVDPRTVSVREQSHRCGVAACSGRVWVDSKHLHDSQLIRFHGPSDGILTAGARAIRTCLALEAAAARNADGVPPIDLLELSDVITPTQRDELAQDWRAARQASGTGILPPGVKYRESGWTPEQLEMAAARQHAVLEIARLAGVDPEELGVSTTSRTYANTWDRKRAFLDQTLAPYIAAIEERISMPDVTPPGYTARYDLSTFLRTSDIERYQAYEVGLRVGALTEEQIAAAESGPVAPSAARPRPATPAPSAVAPPAAAAAVATFGDQSFSVQLEAPPAEVDREKRTIRGLAVPYGVIGYSAATAYQFSKGSLTYADTSRVKLFVNHDANRAIGVATELDDTDDGLYGVFRVAPGAAGDEALALAEAGVYDGLSVGLAFGGEWSDGDDDVRHAKSVRLIEVSLTPAPAFDDARVTQVAASTTTGVTMTSPTAATAVAPPADAPKLSAETVGQIQQLRDAFTAPAAPAVIPAGEGVTRAELPYRFDGTQAEHCFLDDIREGYSQGRSDSRDRVEQFIGEYFGAAAGPQFITGANVAPLTPSQQRPELYVPNLNFTRPLYDLVSTGPITDKTPFILPKFGSVGNLVNPHVENVEPVYGTFTATSQTITPGAHSGKLDIVREVWDQGGSPQLDTILWGEMTQAWFESVEQQIKTLLASSATAELNLAGAVDTPLIDALTNYYAGLQFVRGGNRFTATAADAKLYPALVNAKDAQGRKHLPILTPTNAQGQTDPGLQRTAIGSQQIVPAWALSTGANTRSYNFVPSSVWCWTSTPTRLTFEYQVKSVDLAIWGYSASAILRDSDVKPIDYDTADV
ncbi:MAG: phage portal protein [Dermatophilaceae bacterium]